MLTCPDCDHEFALTFHRYFTAGSGYYTCPECQADCKLELPGWLSLVERCLLIPGVIICSVIGVITKFWIGLALCFIWLCINIPLNVILDGRLGWLELIRSRRPAEPPPLPEEETDDAQTEV